MRLAVIIRCQGVTGNGDGHINRVDFYKTVAHIEGNGVKVIISVCKL